MLNLTEKNKANHASLGQFSTIKNLENRPHYKVLNRIIVIFSIIVLLFLFLPWTQNISGSGSVTTLKPDQRPQTIHTAIAGRIEKWYVKEGDFVTKGDTILFISETKEEYLDPNLIDLTKNQVEAKKLAQQSYGGKVSSLSAQIQAIENEKKEEKLSNSIAGRIGKTIEPALKPMGFDWKIGTALIGAFIAKEVFVAQLGIVYSLGDREDTSDTLREKLKENYSPLVGFCIMLFCLISMPCMATVTITAKESGSWKWAALQLLSLTIIAYIITTIVFQIGNFLGIGMN